MPRKCNGDYDDVVCQYGNQPIMGVAAHHTHRVLSLFCVPYSLLKSNLKAEASDMDGGWGRRGLLGEDDTYGVGGRSANDDATLDFLRAFSGI